MFTLSANGETIINDDPDESSSISFENDECAPEWRCSACGEYLAECDSGWASDCGESVCSDYDPDEHPECDSADAPEYGEGPHTPERVPLSWANSATVRTDAEQDEITVTISVGDPRGAFAFTICRIPDGDYELAGRLVMHTPYPGEPCAHAQLTERHPGTFLVG